MKVRGARRAIAMAVTALVAAGTVLAGCSSSGGGGFTTGQQGFVTGDGTVSIIPAAQRTAAPALSGTTLTGSTWSLAQHRGKIVVLNIWGSWCVPCQQEAPQLVSAAKQLGSTVSFIGLDSRDYGKAQAKAFVARNKVPYPSLYDQSGSLLLGFRGQTSANAIPSTLVIDTQGRVAARVLGAVDATTLVGLVHDVRG